MTNVGGTDPRRGPRRRWRSIPIRQRGPSSRSTSTAGRGNLSPLSINLPVRALDYANAITARQASSGSSEFNVYLRSSSQTGGQGPPRLTAPLTLFILPPASVSHPALPSAYVRIPLPNLLRPPAARRGSTLVVAVFVIALLATFIGLADGLHRHHGHRHPKRGRDLTNAQALANGALEAVYKRWQTYMASKQFSTPSACTRPARRFSSNITAALTTQPQHRPTPPTGFTVTFPGHRSRGPRRCDAPHPGGFLRHRRPDGERPRVGRDDPTPTAPAPPWSSVNGQLGF